VPAADVAASPVPAEPVPARTRPHWGRRVALALAALVALVVFWYALCLYQVWSTGRSDAARPSDAIVVLGAAQYDGRPSPVLERRLEQALALYRDGVAATIVVTGGKQPDDRFTEAQASANWLLRRGVPDEAILREVQGVTTWESLAATARILRTRGLSSVVLVSDPYHLLRAKETAEELGLDAATSPAGRGGSFDRLVREAAGVAVARLPGIGYRRLLRFTE
jgi:uncharacterized SAM-binding protein YcdF (DUF218 family)